MRLLVLIEKEKEAKFYKDIEAGLPFSEEVANRLGMLEYAKRYVNYHIDEKDFKNVKELRENGKLKAKGFARAPMEPLGATA